MKCRFCGGKLRLNRTGRTGEVRRQYYICNQCGLQSSRLMTSKTQSDMALTDEWEEIQLSSEDRGQLATYMYLYYNHGFYYDGERDTICFEDDIVLTDDEAIRRFVEHLMKSREAQGWLQTITALRG